MSVVRWVSDNSSRRFGVLGRAVAQNILLYLDRGLGKELSGKWTPIDTEKSLWCEEANDTNPGDGVLNPGEGGIRFPLV